MEAVAEKIEVFNEKYAVANYYADKKTMYVEWLGPSTHEEYKNLYDSLLKYAENNKVERFISNTIKQGVVSISSRKYFEEVVNPKSVELGMRRTAVITDANVFKRYYLNLLIKANTKFGNPVKLVNNEEEAWEFVLAE